jgi:glycosyltransferase involved in cell wall biosynthesis
VASPVFAFASSLVKLLLATDAWHPQMNGVVRTLSTVVDTLRAAGHGVEVIGVGDFPALPMPSYPEIKVSVWLRGLTARIEAFDPDAIHISTEGPIGYAARRFCRRHGYAFTTSFHTRFPEYLRERLPVPLGLTYAMVRAFHRHASRTLVPTQTLKTDLEQRGFSHLQVWGRGVDTELFAPERRQDSAWTRPLWLNVGRVAPEKNIDSFLGLDLPGTKVVVGDGPKLAELREKYPDVVFPGARFGEELAAYYASADVFVFPSLTDTFGLVMIEAIACGTPVAAYPVTGPLDVLQPGVTGVMHDDLGVAAEQALQLDRDACRNAALGLSWTAIADQFLHALVPLKEDKAPALKEAQ